MPYQSCPFCGGPLKTLSPEHAECLHCQEKIPVKSHLSSEIPPQLLSEIEAVKHLRQSAEFYKAKSKIRYILENPKYNRYVSVMHHIYWQAFLCDYSVVFEKPVSAAKSVYLPTFFEFNYSKMSDNVNYKKAIELCKANNDLVSLKSLKALLEQLEKYAEIFVNLKDKHSKFSVFISFKHLDDYNRPTVDFDYAQKLYQYLDTKLHKKTFFSPVTLDNIGSEVYEPHIYYGLYTASLFVFICTEPQYADSVWVRNEWTRYLKLKKLKPEYRNIVIAIPNKFHKNELPEPLRINEKGQERQFVFFNDANDLIEKVIKSIDFTESSRSKELEKMKIRDIEIEELDRKDTISQEEKIKLEQLIYDQLSSYQKFKGLYKEDPIGIMPVEVLRKLKSRINDKFSKNVFETGKLQHRIRQTHINISKIMSHKEFSADKYRNLRILIDEQMDYLKELSDFGNPSDYFQDDTITDKKSLYKMIDEYKSQSKVYCVKRVKELLLKINSEVSDKNCFELSQASLFSINEIRALIQQISEFGHNLYPNELPFSNTLELDNFVTTIQLKLKSHRDFIEQKNSALQAKKEAEKARLEEKLKGTELTISHLIDRSKSLGYKHNELVSAITYQKNKLTEHKERFGSYPHALLLRFNTPELLDAVIKTAENNQKNLLISKEREQKDREKDRLKDIAKRKDDMIREKFSNPNYSVSEKTYFEKIINEQIQMLQELHKTGIGYLSDFKYPDVKSLEIQINRYEQNKSQFLRKKAIELEKVELKRSDENIKAILNNPRFTSGEEIHLQNLITNQCSRLDQFWDSYHIPLKEELTYYSSQYLKTQLDYYVKNKSRNFRSGSFYR
jgi:hypothetical protein